MNRRRRRVMSLLLLGAVVSAVGATGPSDAATRRVRPGTRRPPKVVPTSSVAPTTVPTSATTTTMQGVPAARIATFESTGSRHRLVLDAPARTDVTAVVDIEAIGFEEGTKRLAFPGPGVTELVFERTLNPDTRYDLRVQWTQPNGPSGEADTKTIEPVYPQPIFRGNVPLAGPGWTVTLDSEFRPTRRNPCAPISVHYDPTNAPLDITAMLRTAIQQASEASGVPMTLDSIGKTPAAKLRPLIINWETPTTSWLGLTRQTYMRDSRGVIWRTNMSISLARGRRVADGRWETIVLHELGHVLGLQHSHDNTSLMFSPGESNGPWPWVTTFFTDGDKRGLRAVNVDASGGCSPTIERASLWDGQPR